jgi:anti-sigma factor RsiW
MMHTHIQEKLLLYLDGNLPDKEMQQIREHLSTCSVCAEQHEVLASVWRSESRFEKVKPSPFLWTKLQARIKEYEQTPVFVWDLKTIFQGITVRPIPAFAVIGAIIVGVYLGSPRESLRYERAQSINQLAGAADELGLDQFDVIPPGTLGSTLINISNRQK